MKNWWTCNLIVVLVGLVGTLPASSAKDQLEVRSDRWLEVRHPIGQVLYLHGTKSQPAFSGMRLQAVGDGIMTKQGASAVLAIDIGTGFINISENTQLNIQNLFTKLSAPRKPLDSSMGVRRWRIYSPWFHHEKPR